MRRIVVAALALALSITGLLASPGLAAEPITFQVQAGSASFTSGVLGAGNRFYPEAVAIHPGDSLAFNFVGPHTVTFIRPPGPLFALFVPSGDTNITSPTQSVNSGFVGGAPADSYKLTFNV